MQLAEQLLRRFGSLYHLMSADHQAFAAKRPGDASYTQLQAIAELALRFFPAICRRKTPCSIRASPGIICKACWRIASERSFGIVLDNQHRVIRHQEMFAGTISSVVVYPREIVREALKANAAALILAHNHPSGKAEPSHADRLITEQVVKACQLLEIRVLDHLVIGRGECVSLPSADGFKRFFAILVGSLAVRDLSTYASERILRHL